MTAATTSTQVQLDNLSAIVAQLQNASGASAAAVAALSNYVQSQALPRLAPVPAPYTAIIAPAITRKASGFFLILAVVTISIHDDTGTLTPGDGVVYSANRNGAFSINPILTASAQATTGANPGETVSANLPMATLDFPGIEMGDEVSYQIIVRSANGHTSGVVTETDGAIFVIELPVGGT
jgi:hypothetical protein